MNSNFSIESSHQISITTIEHSLSNRIGLEVQIVSWVSLILINICNGYLIHVMKNQMKTQMDWLIMMDSVLCIMNCIPIIRFGTGTLLVDNTSLCVFLTFLTYFINAANRLVTVSISIYRYFLVVKYASMQEKSQRDILTQKKWEK